MRYRISTLLIFTLSVSVVLALRSSYLYRESQIERGVAMLGSFDVPTYRYDSDPRILIRIVNHCRKLGHRDSIKCLRRFADKFVRQDEGEHLNTLDVIVPLIYLPKEVNGKLPTWKFSESIRSYELNLDNWDTTIRELNGIPFETEFRGRGGSGYPTANLYLIEWAERDAKLRTEPLQPVDNLFENFQQLVSEVVDLDYFKPYRDNNEGTESSVAKKMRRQVYYLVSDLVNESEAIDPSDWIPTDENWTKLKAQFKSRSLHWDEEKLEYSSFPD